MSNWKNKSPIDMANRIIACDIVRSIGPKKISMIEDKELSNEFLLPCIDDEGKEYFEIDWEFMLFKVTEHQIGKLMENFQPKEKEEKKESLLYGANGEKI